MKKVIAFVHAKGTSERVPNKNLRYLGDTPLFVHAVKNAKQASAVDFVVIDSDSEEILELGERYGAIPLKRPGDLASNSASGDDLAYWQASNYPDSEIVLQVVPTSPFLKSESINQAIQMIDSETNSIVGVRKDVFYFWRNGRPDYYIGKKIPNSSEMESVVYETTGLYVNKTGTVLRTRKRIDIASSKPFFLSRVESVDINTPEDFEFAEIIWQGIKKNL